MYRGDLAFERENEKVGREANGGSVDQGCQVKPFGVGQLALMEVRFLPSEGDWETKALSSGVAWNKCYILFFSLGLHWRRMEIPRLEVQWEL